MTADALQRWLAHKCIHCHREDRLHSKMNACVYTRCGYNANADVVMAVATVL
jgi:hypothetical protein